MITGLSRLRSRTSILKGADGDRGIYDVDGIDDNETEMYRRCGGRVSRSSKGGRQERDTASFRYVAAVYVDLHNLRRF